MNQNRGWILGENGTLLKTTDAGTTWIDEHIAPDYTFKRILSVDAANLWLLGYKQGTGYSTIYYSSDCGTTWIERLQTYTLPDSLRAFSDIYFNDHLQGWSVGADGKIITTDDGALTWQLQGKIYNYSLEKIQFFNDNIGVINGGLWTTQLYPEPSDESVSRGIILRTTDAGAQWDTIYHDTINIESVYFRNSQLGWAVGTSFWIDSFDYGQARNFIMKTTDGGITWVIQSSIWLHSIYFIDDYKGLACGDGGVVATTTNGGENWAYSIPGSRYLNDIIFRDSLNGYIIGSEGIILQSSNGGQSWFQYDSKFISGITNDVHFINSDTGWFVNSDIYRTTDGGGTWSPSGLSGVKKIDCTDRNNCWACGNGGKIVYTSDAGASWIQQTSGTTSNLRDIEFATPQIGWTGEGGTIILKTTTGGTTWFPQTTANIGGLDKIIIQNSQRAWLYGTYASAVTTSGGYPWSLHSGILPVFWLNPDTGWAKGQELYRTFDGGQSWDVVGGGYVYVFFVNANTGWTRSVTSISKTTDGGFTWQPDLQTGSVAWLTDMHFTDTNHGWAVGLNGTLIHYGYNMPMPSDNDTVAISINPDWNMISLPLRMNSTLKDSVYPSSESFAYFYNKGYAIEETLKLGSGYWLKFQSQQLPELKGEPLHCLSFDVQKGWNMIGSISNPVPVSSITSMPAGISVSPFYEYNGTEGYRMTDTIKPGYGYWVKVSQDCRFTFADSTIFVPNGNILIDRTIAELPPSPPESETSNLRSQIPNQFSLGQNYPNPFNPSTVIRYQLPVNSYVTLMIYDILGREIVTLVDGMQDAGYKSVNFEATNYASGIYLYKIVTDKYIDVKKCLYVR
ncbi:MAG: T9SS type A sorting domain-containing protein [Ignavibacteriae bacterium]|nr:T9SS type A sorting domain-containing protein [Ignavibacteriota bacterium]